MRLALAALLIAGLAYLYVNRQSAPPVAPPQPAHLELPASPVLSLSEIERVRRSTNDPDTEVRWAAIQLLVTLKDPDIVAVADRIVEQDADPEVRQRVIGLLRRIENISVLPPLIRGLRDPEKSVRIACLKSMSEIGDPAAIPWATAAIKDYEPEVRAEALRTLSRFQDRRKEEFEKLAAKLRQDYEDALRRSRASPFDLDRQVRLPTVK